MAFDKTILVTGFAGFIGSNLINVLTKRYPNYYFVGFDSFTYAANKNIPSTTLNSNFGYIRGDITKVADIVAALKRYKITDVIHLAAESHVDNSISNPSVFANTNVIGTLNLLNAVKDFWDENTYDKHRFYHVSTDEVYGSLEKDEEAFTEKSPYNPHSPYSASKAASDHFVRAYHDTYGLNTVISNCSNNYGKFQHIEKLIPKTCYCLVNGKDIPVYGTGENIRDWLFVEDHVNAIDNIFHNAQSGSTWNIGGNNEITNIDLVKQLCDYYDEYIGQEVGISQKKISFVEDRKGHDLRYAINSTKLQTELGWKPTKENKMKEVAYGYFDNFTNIFK
jgi:dTDP-glucose 4,6-dehydratase